MQIYREGSFKLRKTPAFLLIFFLFLISTAAYSANIKLDTAEPFFYDPSSKGVKLTFTDEVSTEDLRPNIKITPSPGYFTLSKQYKKPVITVYGSFTPGLIYNITINDAQINKNKDGKYQDRLTSKKLSFVASEPAPSFEIQTLGSVIELSSPQTVPFSYTNVGNFKVDFLNLPPFIAFHFQDIAHFNKLDSADNFRNSSPCEDFKKLTEKYTEDLFKLEAKRIEQISENFKEALKKNPVPDAEVYKANKLVQKTQEFLGSKDRENAENFSLPLDLRDEPQKAAQLALIFRETKQDNYHSASRLLQITDLALTYKFTKNKLLIWVTSLSQGKPVKNASLLLKTKDNEFIFPGKTDSDGILIINETKAYDTFLYTENKFEYSKKNLKTADLRSVMAATANDSIFTPLNSNRYYSSQARATAPDSEDPAKFSAKAFTERGVYKPGDDVYWKAAIRQLKGRQAAIPADAKVRVKIYDPLNDVIYNEELPISEFGTVNGKLTLSANAKRGAYSLSLELLKSISATLGTSLDQKWDYLMDRKDSTKAKTGTNAQTSDSIYLTTEEFQVQDFTPPRHYVEMAMSKSTRKIKKIVGRLDDQDFIDCKITSKYYSGGNLKHTKVQWSAKMKDNNFNVGDYPLYDFGSSGVSPSGQLIDSGTAILNKDGELQVSIPMSQDIADGIKTVEFTATVLDIDGRPATLVQSYKVPVPIKLGISRIPDSAAPGENIPVNVIALDEDGTLINKGKVQLSLMKKRNVYTQKRFPNGQIYYAWEDVWTPFAYHEKEISDNSALFELVFPEGSEYLLKAVYSHGRKRAAAASSASIAYSRPYFSTISDRDLAQRSENEIHLQPTANPAKAGEKLALRYSIPRGADYALLTWETNDLLDYKVIALKSSGGVIETDVKEHFKPNAFFSMAAPSTRSGFPLYAYEIDSEFPRMFFGYADISIKDEVAEIKVNIAPEKKGELVAAPGEDFVLNFKVTNPAGEASDTEIAVCVVDEAILSLTVFKTPSFKSISEFLPHLLSVFSGDTRISLISNRIMQVIQSNVLTGGGEGSGSVTSDLKIRKDFRPVPYWNPAITPDKDGKFSINFTLPDSMTSYRIYAVALDKSAGSGQSERQLRVTKDFYLEPSVPSYMSIGDRADVTVAIQNKTAKSGTAEIKVEKAENIIASFVAEKALMKPQSVTTHKLLLEAEKATPKASVTLSGNFNGMKDAVQRDLRVTIPSLSIKAFKNGIIREQENIAPKIPEYVSKMPANTIDGSVKLSISPNPFIRLLPAIEYMIEYPHGCLEQTSSRLLALYAAYELASNNKLPSRSRYEIEKLISKSLDHLLSMQLNSGGFSFWKSSGSESWWATQYALFALISINESLRTPRIDEAESLAANYVAKHIGYRAKNMDSETAFAVYNLAMLNKINASDLDAYHRNIPKDLYKEEREEVEIFLNLALAHLNIAAGQQPRKPNDSLEPYKGRNFSWRSSNAKKNALTLLLATLTKSNKVADNFAVALTESLGPKGRWNSTADTGLALISLTAYYLPEIKKTPAKVELEIKAKGENKKYEALNEGLLIDMNLKEFLKNPEISVKAPNNTKLFYSIAYDYPDILDRKEPEKNGFIVGKTFTNMSGGKEIKPGDIVKVVLTIEDMASEDKYKNTNYEYLILEDPIPAGFEAINSALKNDALPPTLENPEDEYYYTYSSDGFYEFWPTHREFSEGSLFAYKNYYWSGAYKLTYYLRAVCPGDFVAKPTFVGLMYDCDVYGLTPSSRIKIAP